MMAERENAAAGRNADLRAVVAEDEPPARMHLLRLIEAQGVEIIAECATGAETVKAVREHTPDVLFLDIEMPEGNGLWVLQQLDEKSMPLLVITTAYEQHALRGYDFQAVDYLLKPYTPTQIERAVRRARERLAEIETMGLAKRFVHLIGDVRPGMERARDEKSAGWLDRIAVRGRQETRFIPVDAIDWLEAEDVYVRLHSAGQTYLTRQKMSEIEQRLDPAHFVRIHRSTIVNKARVKSMKVHPDGRHELMLEGGTVLRVARARKDDVERSLRGV